MTDFYCNEVLNGSTPISRVEETDSVLAYHHTRPSYPVHIVVIPKRHVASLTTLLGDDSELLVEMVEVIDRVAAAVVAERGSARVITNLGDYQESEHLHWHVISGDRLVSA